MEKIVRDIKKHSLEYGSIPFWSWNDKLKEKELRAQIQNMKELKMNGFFMHARCGLETEYLSKEWFKAVNVCIDEAKKLGMQAWSYDENGWPSGFAGGKLLNDPDNHSVYLKHEFSESFPEKTEGIYAIYALNGRNKPIKTKKAVDGAEKYLLVYYCKDSSYVDTLRADITEKFVQETHVLYKKKTGEDFGKAMPGFFTDEPQYYRYASPYSKFMEKWFKSEYGYSVFDAIPAIFTDFEGSETYLYDYHRLTHKKFMQGFAKKLYDSACKLGVQITGHGIEESSLGGQMLCCGSLMPFYQYEHIPGIDYLGKGHQTQMAPKQLGSVCEQLGKKKALTETFACCGWDVTPAEIKSIAELQYAGGVNLMCQHLYPYSERGQRKRDYPNHYSRHNTWQDKMPEFDEYFNNLGYILSRGKEYANTLVIHPIHSAWLTYRRHMSDSSISELESNTTALLTKLASYQIPYHFGEETMMKSLSRVDGAKITVGKCVYDTVILPKVDTLDDSTYNLLIKYTENGGKIYVHRSHLPKYIDGRPAPENAFDFLKNALDLDDESVFEGLCASVPYSLRKDGNAVSQVLCQVRSTKNYGRIYYLTNIKKDEIKDAVFTVNGSVRLASLDCQTLDIKPLRGRINGDKTEILLSFAPNSSFVLIESDKDYLPFEIEMEKAFISLPRVFKFAKSPENILTLDRASISYDGKDFSELRPIERIRDNLLFERYAGDIWLKYEFNTEFIPKKLAFVCEKPSVMGLYVNGNELPLGKKTWFDMYFAKTDILPYLKVGKNEVTVKMNYFQNDYVYHVLYGNVMESLRNCLNFDTEIEAAYLLGDFAVKTDISEFTDENAVGTRLEHAEIFTITEQKNEVKVTNLTKEGYPFFSGKLELSAAITHTAGKPAFIKLDGHFATCDVLVNGKAAGSMLFNRELDLAPYLKNGKNTVKLILCASPRNMMGPHHLNTATPESVSPPRFSFEGKWNKGDCPGFNYGYGLVRFGFGEK